MMAETIEVDPKIESAGVLIDPSTVLNAVTSLLNLDAKLNQEDRERGIPEKLFDNERAINIVVTLKTLPTEKKEKPVKIPLPHPFREGCEICLIVKDPQRKFKDIVKEEGITDVKKVIGLSKLQKKYIQYEQKRNLCSAYGLFLADARIIPQLPHLIGKTFFEKKKQPISINCKKKGLKRVVEKMRDSTFFYLGKGSCSQVQVGHTAMTPDQIAENLRVCIWHIAKNVPKKFANIQSMHIKTQDSPSVTFYTSLPESSVLSVGTVPAKKTKLIEMERPQSKKQRK